MTSGAGGEIRSEDPLKCGFVEVASQSGCDIAYGRFGSEVVFSPQLSDFLRHDGTVTIGLAAQIALSETAIRLTVAKDGKRITGRNATSGDAVVCDRETQKVQVIPGVGPQERFEKWTEDGQALLVSSETLSEARMYRVEVATGK